MVSTRWCEWRSATRAFTHRAEQTFGREITDFDLRIDIRLGVHRHQDELRDAKIARGRALGKAAASAPASAVMPVPVEAPPAANVLELCAAPAHSTRGRKLPPEVFSESEVRALLDACVTAAKRPAVGVRNRALLAVLWRSGIRTPKRSTSCRTTSTLCVAPPNEVEGVGLLRASVQVLGVDLRFFNLCLVQALGLHTHHPGDLRHHRFNGNKLGRWLGGSVAHKSRDLGPGHRALGGGSARRRPLDAEELPFPLGDRRTVAGWLCQSHLVEGVLGASFDVLGRRV